MARNINRERNTIESRCTSRIISILALVGREENYHGEGGKGEIGIDST